ncbi:hypothetical protein Pint_11984 [Pistacia integerrima]|uniref:Uncharacterized protein n=1 Tax=Pistacia integerrima TaxID=434235 RepID=A0ACC0XG75_9ROSI|nr:hypothetical protein Pint_11984 [Pistacia integerrima]
MTFYGGESLLSEITKKPSAFPSGGTKRLPFWGYVGVSKDTKKIPKTKLIIELVKHLCKEIAEGKTDYTTTCLILKRSLLLAGELGVCEIVEAIIKSYPDAIWFTNEKNQNLFHLVVMNRQEKVFNLIYQMIDRKHLLLMSQDVDKNNILHLAGKLAPENKLNVIAGAAFQMQRELQWYKEVENIVPAECKNEINCVGETPAVVFHKSHKKLVTEGEKWMKEAATSCIVAATVTATLVFQAAFGGTNGYNKLSVFMTFGFSDALSLFSSIAAAIIFMSIITARYKQDDFLEALPRKFILGVVFMFISITSMMVAFGTTVYQIFYEKKAYLMLGLVGVSACLPMLLFVASQFSLIWHLFIYTYRPGLFSKPSKRCTRPSN